MKKIISFLWKNWYYFLLVFPFVEIFYVNRSPTNDIWFLLNNGRYVLNHGIPYIEPFTIHEGLHYVMQQWLSSTIFYGIYSKLGGYGLLTFTILISFIIIIVYYKLCYRISNNKLISILITVGLFFVGRKYFVIRPQLFTYLILLLELFCMEEYIKTNDGKKLIWMPVLSILLINMHASMWLLQFVFMLPILCNCIRIKNITIDKIRFKPLLYTLLLMLLGGFINPYGYKAITYVFDSYNIPEINKLVTEMMPVSIDTRTGKFLIIAILLVVLISNYQKRKKMDIRHLLLICGTALLAFMHDKCVVFFWFYFGYCLAYLLADIKNLRINNKYLVSLVRGIKGSLMVCLVVTIVYSSIILYKNYEFKNTSIPDITNYILDNYDKNDVILFVDYDDGGYTEFMGLKSYFDPRAEVFHNKLNKKDNIIKEALGLEKATDEYYDKFIKKYNFTHLIISGYLSDFTEYMNKNDNYVLEYNQYFESNKDTYITNRLFVRKDISIKKNEVS